MWIVILLVGRGVGWCQGPLGCGGASKLVGQVLADKTAELFSELETRESTTGLFQNIYLFNVFFWQRCNVRYSLVFSPQGRISDGWVLGFLLRRRNRCAGRRKYIAEFVWTLRAGCLWKAKSTRSSNKLLIRASCRGRCRCPLFDRARGEYRRQL